MFYYWGVSLSEFTFLRGIKNTYIYTIYTTFCSQITFGLTGRWQKWSKLAYFRKGGPCREQYDAKIINTYKCQLQHVARNFLVLFML